jgi:hypothetical protein
MYDVLHRRALARLAVVALAAVLVSSCGFSRRISRLFGGDIKMTVSVSPQLNNNSPVPVEVLVFYDPKLMEQVMAMTAQEWFQARPQFIQDNGSKQPGFDTNHWEWVPNQTIDPFKLSYRIGARGGVVFVGYASAGAHRQSIDPQLNITLSLGPTDFTVTQTR